MIIKAKDMKETSQQMRGGDGEVQMLEIVPSDKMIHMRLFKKSTIKKGCSIGPHRHVGEVEYYYILQGQGVVTEDDGEKRVCEGDVVITGWGESHSIRNDEDEDLVFIAAVSTEA